MEDGASAATSPLPDVPIYASDIEMSHAGHVYRARTHLISDWLHNCINKCETVGCIRVDKGNQVLRGNSARCHFVHSMTAWVMAQLPTYVGSSRHSVQNEKGVLHADPLTSMFGPIKFLSPVSCTLLEQLYCCHMELE
jgi:hypothetical protein